MDINEIKARFGVIGNDPGLNSALETAAEIAGTELSVLITGESGVGKEAIPKIIHHMSPRKHNNYVAINCGAIPEGTIESELFGHEKGSFTGANEARKGYFEVADKGTIFLDEVGELPLSTQARLLRVLENGEFIRVGSSKVQKTDVRVIAASNINFRYAISKGKFREDLYYRLNAVPISIPNLHDRKDDIYLLFRKFALDFADKYNMPTIRLDDNARKLLENYRWPGNIRQLKNVAEQMSVLEKVRNISLDALAKYLPKETDNRLPVFAGDTHNTHGELSDRDIIFKILVQLRQEVDQLKKTVSSLKSQDSSSEIKDSSKKIEPPYTNLPSHNLFPHEETEDYSTFEENISDNFIESIEKEKSLSLDETNIELIKKALMKHHGKRKPAAQELGISERTLYRKIKELNLND
ncbi:MAG: sigma-54 dependent transcriptional regulator [Bacteroidales bacterium]